MDRLIDTNVISYWIKRRPEFTLYKAHLSGYRLNVSFPSYSELLVWAEKLKWGVSQQNRFNSVIQKLVILQSELAICREYAYVMVCRQIQPISVDDAWIAATALAYNLELVTHNPSDFKDIPGLTVITEAP